jgi:AcrR family transcriptional regulator
MKTDAPRATRSTKAPPRGRVNRREENRQRTRRDIVAAARRLFATDGVENTTCEAIASRAQVSRATFFNYFPSKSAVVDELVLEMSREFRVLLEAEARLDLPTAERIRRVFTQVAERVEQEGDYFRALLGVSEQLWGEVNEARTRIADMHAGILLLLQSGLARGDVRQDFPLEVLTEVLGGSFIAFVHNYRVSPDYPLVSRLDAMAQIIGGALQPVQR